jgi:L-ribulose-5-phosphate 4-epimerase
LTEQEVASDYESNTGNVIIERFKMLKPMHTPAVLVANHGPFTWGKDADEAVHNAVALEAVAQMALGSLTLKPALHPIPSFLSEKHFSRKHGPKAYYGQENGNR